MLSRLLRYRLGSLHTEGSKALLRRTHVSSSTRSPGVGARGFSCSYPRETEIGRLIASSIKATGPISLATYMQLCLSHPIEGYYMKQTREIFGTRGDFTTSPEISQVFGDLLGIWFCSQYDAHGHGRPIRLVELGPGRGTLMEDVIRVLNNFARFRSVLSEIVLVETSNALRAKQEDKLKPYTSHPTGPRLTFVDSIDDVEQDDGLYTMIVAHEFFDALPIHVIEKVNGEWNEVMVDLLPNNALPDPTPENVESITPTNELAKLTEHMAPLAPSLDPLPAVTSLVSPPPEIDSPLSPSILASAATVQSPKLRRVLSRTSNGLSNLLGLSSSRFVGVPNGTRIEVSQVAFQVVRRMGVLVDGGGTGKDNGCALIVDYGADRFSSDSLRAFKEHEQVHEFHQPGQCDLTADVDFAYLKEAVQDTATSHGPLTQRDFLLRMGMELHLQRLLQKAPSDERATSMREAALRLVDPDGMGSQYKFLALTGRSLADNPPWPFHP